MAFHGGWALSFVRDNTVWHTSVACSWDSKESPSFQLSGSDISFPSLPSLIKCMIKHDTFSTPKKQSPFLGLFNSKTRNKIGSYAILKGAVSKYPKDSI